MVFHRTIGERDECHSSTFNPLSHFSQVVTGAADLVIPYGIPVNLVEIAGDCIKPLTLLCDVGSFWSILCSICSSSTPDDDLLMDDAPLRRFEFAEFSKIRATVVAFLVTLRHRNIDIEFFDGDQETWWGKPLTIQKHHAFSALQYRRMRHVESDLNSQDATKICRRFGTHTEGVLPPPLLRQQLHAAIREAGCRLWVSPSHVYLWMAKAFTLRRQRSQVWTWDCEQQTGESGHGGLLSPVSLGMSPVLTRVWAILSNNWEFALMDNARFLLAGSFDSTKQLCWLLKTVFYSSPDFVLASQSTLSGDRLQELSSLEVRLFTPERFAEALGVRISTLQNASFLVGNQFSSGLVKYRHHGSNILGNLKPIRHAARLVSSQGRSIEDWVFPDTKEWRKVPDVKEALTLGARLSIAMYRPHNPKEFPLESFPESDFMDYCEWRTNTALSRHISGASRLLPTNLISSAYATALRALTSRGCISTWMLRAATEHMYCRPPHHEYTDPEVPFGIEDALQELRAWIYGVLVLPTSTARFSSDVEATAESEIKEAIVGMPSVKEYGRCGKQFQAIVTVYPKRVSGHLHLSEILCRPTWSAKNASATLQTFFSLALTAMDAARPTFCTNTAISQELLEVFVSVIKQLRFKTAKGTPGPFCFLKHEIESLIAAILITSSRYRNQNTFRLLSDGSNLATFARALVEELYDHLLASGFDLPSDDPLDMCGYDFRKRGPSESSRVPDLQHSKHIPRVGLNGLVSSFRSSVVFGWFQVVWQHLVDVYSLFHAPSYANCHTLSYEPPPPCLLFDGDVFRWVYAAGAETGERVGEAVAGTRSFAEGGCDDAEVQLSPEIPGVTYPPRGRCAPSYVHSVVKRQKECVTVARAWLLKSVLVGGLAAGFSWVESPMFFFLFLITPGAASHVAGGDSRSARQTDPNSSNVDQIWDVDGRPVLLKKQSNFLASDSGVPMYTPFWRVLGLRGPVCEPCSTARRHDAPARQAGRGLHVTGTTLEAACLYCVASSRNFFWLDFLKFFFNCI